MANVYSANLLTVNIFGAPNFIDVALPAGFVYVIKQITWEFITGDQEPCLASWSDGALTRGQFKVPGGRSITRLQDVRYTYAGPVTLRVAATDLGASSGILVTMDGFKLVSP